MPIGARELTGSAVHGGCIIQSVCLPAPPCVPRRPTPQPGILEEPEADSPAQLLKMLTAEGPAEGLPPGMCVSVYVFMYEFVYVFLYEFMYVFMYVFMLAPVEKKIVYVWSIW